ncbi:nitrate reductase molybdenum cofactor assembly chaperone [Selenomonas dianae]|uniref:Nitrate reductase molybdenum cofactor assembly chaperone n=1 Tax=Selenomonas dianae TaxID=135079 RepID=A0ABP3CM13_9FIRM|nr:nitrate reductase molybdenum cofactor assembly chaperone [Selenomonas dianae]WLD82229.1 nitrate reductase molybdenum cofactor assembly chaperone [Selenomonas dianae]
METNRIQTPLLLTSYLFEYPSADWWEGVPTHAAAVADVERPQSREVFEEFFGYIGETERQEFEDAYVRAFDFSQNTNLYLTTHNRTDFGKQAEELLRYKQLFLDAGYDLERELPDYLPALLELAAAVPERESLHILTEVRPKLELLRDRLIEAKLPYAFLLDVVLTEASALEGRTA